MVKPSNGKVDTTVMEKKLDELLYLLPQLSTSSALQLIVKRKGTNLALFAAMAAMKEANTVETDSLYDKLLSDKNPVDSLSKQQQEVLATIVTHVDEIIRQMFYDSDMDLNIKSRKLSCTNQEKVTNYENMCNAIIEAISTGKTDKLNQFGKYNYLLAGMKKVIVNELSKGVQGFGMGLMMAGAVASAAATPSVVLFSLAILPVGLLIIAAGMKLEKKVEPLAQKHNTLFHTSSIQEAASKGEKTIKQISPTHKPTSTGNI